MLLTDFTTRAIGKKGTIEEAEKLYKYIQKEKLKHQHHGKDGEFYIFRLFYRI